VQWTVTFWPFTSLGPVPALRSASRKSKPIFISSCLVILCSMEAALRSLLHQEHIHLTEEHFAMEHQHPKSGKRTDGGVTADTSKGHQRRRARRGRDHRGVTEESREVEVARDFSFSFVRRASRTRVGRSERATRHNDGEEGRRRVGGGGISPVLSIERGSRRSGSEGVGWRQRRRQPSCLERTPAAAAARGRRISQGRREEMAPDTSRDVERIRTAGLSRE
jgi:hypothetical protein